jgi:diguanylate cyclase (GGDEF)-like protein
MTGNGEGAGDDVEADAVALVAARRLLRADTRAEAAAVLRDALTELGGRVVATSVADFSALPYEVSLGVGEPAVVVPADGSDVTRRRLERQVAQLLDDARAAAVRSDRYHRQAARARTDALTGLAERGEIDVRLAEATDEDVVCLMDLDGFKEVNDTQGHRAGDEALRRFGHLLRTSVREVDFVGRYGGDEFLVLFSGTPLDVAEQRMGALIGSWTDEGPGVGVSIGVAPVGVHGAEVAVAAADRALYRAKRAGGARVRLAEEADYVSP